MPEHNNLCAAKPNFIYQNRISVNENKSTYSGYKIVTAKLLSFVHNGAFNHVSYYSSSYCMPCRHNSQPVC